MKSGGGNGGIRISRTGLSCRYFNASLQPAIITGMDTAECKRRWYCPTPGKLVIGLLVVECLLWLSNWLGWPSWHKGYAVLTSIAAVGIVLILMLLWFVAALVFRRRFQFSIWSLLLMTVAVALPFSWLGVEMKKAKEQREAVADIEAVSGIVQYDYELDSTGGYIANASPSGAVRLRNLLGDGFFNNVDRVYFLRSQVSVAVRKRYHFRGQEGASR